MILDKELLTAFIAIFGIVLYALLNSRVSERSLPVISNSEVLLNTEVVEDTCSICYSEVRYSGSFLTRCDHWYHKECLRPWFKQQEELENALSCPYCTKFASSNANEEAKRYAENMKTKPLDSKKFNKFIKYIFVNSYRFDYEFLINEISEVQPGFNINDILDDGNTLFALAVMNNNTHAIEYFLNYAFKDINDINEKEQDDLTIAAIKLGHLEFALFMIEQTAVLERESDAIFFEAVKNDQVSIVKFLIEKGADINKKEASSGLNAVQLAVSGEKVKTFRLLYRSGKVDLLNVVDKSGMSLIEHFIVKGNSDLLQFVLGHESPESVSEIVNKVDAEGRSPLLLACIHTKANVAQVLIEFGAEIGLQCPYGQSPIEYSIENVENHDDLFEVLLNSIKNDRQKLKSVLEYAKRNEFVRFVPYLERAINNLDLMVQDFNEMIQTFEAGTEKFAIIKYQVNSYSISNIIKANAVSSIWLIHQLEVLVLGLFTNGEYDILLRLLLSSSDNIVLNVVLSKIELDLWFKFLKTFIESSRKDELINYLSKDLKNSIITNYYYFYTITFDLPCDERFSKVISDNQMFKCSSAGILISQIFQKFDKKLQEILEKIINDLKQDPSANGYINLLIDNLETIIEITKVSTDNEKLLELIESRNLFPAYIVTICVFIFETDSNEEFIKEKLNALAPEHLYQLINPITELFQANLHTLFSRIFKFIRLLPSNFQPEIYRNEEYERCAMTSFKLSDFQIFADLTYNFTFKTTPEHVALGLPEYIQHSPVINRSESYFCNVISDLEFESSDLLLRYISSLHRMGFNITPKVIRHENITFLIGSDEIIDFFQNEEIKLKFDAKFVDEISIENISERYKHNPFLLIPDDLEHFPSNTDENWGKIEVLTGKNFGQIMMEKLVPQIDNDHKIYLGARNIFIYWMNSPHRELLMEIKSKNLKKILAIEFPELGIHVEN